MRAAWFVLLASTTAVAQPRSKECVPSNGSPRVVVAAGKATACFSNDDRKTETCFAIPPGGTPTKVAAPPLAKPASRTRAELREVNGALAACLGAKCTPLGKTTLAAVTALKAQLPALPFPNGNLESADEAFLLTGDAKALVIEEGGKRALWSIANDKEIALVGPPKTHGLMLLEVASGALISTWTDCAGPCGKSIFVDSAGKNHGAWFPAGRAIGLDDRRFAIIPTDEGATFRILDAATGAQLAALPAVGPDGSSGPRATRIDDRTLLLLRSATDPKDQGGIWELRYITAPPGKPVTLGAPSHVAWCRPP